MIFSPTDCPHFQPYVFWLVSFTPKNGGFSQTQPKTLVAIRIEFHRFDDYRWRQQNWSIDGSQPTLLLAAVVELLCAKQHFRPAGCPVFSIIGFFPLLRLAELLEMLHSNY